MKTLAVPAERTKRAIAVLHCHTILLAANLATLYEVLINRHAAAPRDQRTS